MMWVIHRNLKWMDAEWEQIIITFLLGELSEALAVSLMCVISDRVIRAEIQLFGWGVLQKGRRAQGTNISERECDWIGYSLDVEISSAQENEL